MNIQILTKKKSRPNSPARSLFSANDFVTRNPFHQIQLFEPGVSIMKKFVIIMFLLISISAMGLAKDIQVGKCNISLDLGTLDPEIDPSDTTIDDNDIITDMTILIDLHTKSAGFIYIMDLPRPFSTSLLENALSSSMENMCGRVSVEKYGNGAIGTGLFKKGGQKCWGVTLPMDQNGDQTKRVLTIISAFKNASLNEYLVKNTTTKDVICPV